MGGEGGELDITIFENCFLFWKTRKTSFIPFFFVLINLRNRKNILIDVLWVI